MPSIFVHDNPQNWDEMLPCLMMAYRATDHKSTGCSPNLMMFGRENRFPVDLMAGLPPDRANDMCPIQYIEWLKQTMESVFETAYQNLGSAAKRQKRDYDSTLKTTHFSTGEWVWRWYPPEANKKLGLGWIGPYLVLENVSPSLCRIQKSEISPILTIHKDHLKAYQGRNLPENWLMDESRNLSVFDDLDNNWNQTSSPEALRSPVTTKSGRVVKPKKILDL
jgi:hypothetical protein